MFPAVAFNQPLFLLLVPLAFLAMVILGWLFVRHQQELLERFGDPETLRRFSRFSGSGLKRRTVFYLALAFALAFLAAAEPTMAVIKSGRTFNAILVCDASTSMDAEDTPGGIPRRELATNNLFSLLAAYPDGYFGVVPFAGAATGYGMTNEQQALRFLVNHFCLSKNVRSAGSDLAVGLEEALVMIKDSREAIGTVILLSDGGDFSTIGQGLSKIAEKYNQAKIRILAGGLGGRRPVPIPVRDPKTGELVGYHADGGVPSETRLNEAPLKYLAEETGGVYQQIESGEELVEIVRSHGWDSRLIERESRESLVWLPLSALLLVLLIYLVDKRFIG